MSESVLGDEIIACIPASITPEEAAEHLDKIKNNGFSQFPQSESTMAGSIITSKDHTYQDYEEFKKEGNPNYQARSFCLLCNHGIRLVVKTKTTTSDPEREEDTSETEVKHYFLCLHNDCLKKNDAGFLVKLDINGNTSLGCNHMREKHQSLSKKTVTKNKKDNMIKINIEECCEGFRQNPKRWMANIFGVIAAKHGHSYASYEGPEFALVLGELRHCIPDFKDGSLDIRKSQVEQYCHIKKIIQSEFSMAKEWYRGMPFACILIDLYKSPISNTKFVGIRISWAYAGKLHSYLLAMRLYKASYKEVEKEAASFILTKWVVDVLKSYDIHINTAVTSATILSHSDVLAGTGDSGPDVKRCMVKILDMHREWCGAHLLNLCLIDAFGGQVGRQRTCTNDEAKKLITAAKNIIERINKGGLIKAYMDQEKATKLVNAPSHRWSCMFFVLESIFSNWDTIVDAYNQVNEVFELNTEELKNQLLEYHALIVAVRLPLLTSQKIQEFASHTFFAQLYSLYTITLDPTKGQLEVKKMNDFQKENVSVPRTPNFVHISNLTASTQESIAILRTALNKRFFHERYHPLKSINSNITWKNVYGLVPIVTMENVSTKMFKTGLIFEMQVLLNPRLKSFSCIRKLCEQVDIDDNNLPKDFPTGDWCFNPRIATSDNNIRLKLHDLIKKACENEIRRLALIVAKREVATQHHRSMTDSNFVTPAPIGKSRKTSSYPSMISPDNRPASPPSGVFEDIDSFISRVANAMIDNEINEFKKEIIDNEKYDVDDAPEWWGEIDQLNKYPCLSRVATALFGVLPGSGALECDIGSVGDIITKKRGSLDPGLAEVEVMIRVNNALTECDITKIYELGTEWKQNVPKRPSSPSNTPVAAALVPEGIDDSVVTRTNVHDQNVLEEELDTRLFLGNIGDEETPASCDTRTSSDSSDEDDENENDDNVRINKRNRKSSSASIGTFNS